MVDIVANLLNTQSQIRLLEKKYGCTSGTVQLLIASKTQTCDSLQTLYYAGQRNFGENYLSEALVKINKLKELQIIWHFIGPLQSNKLKKIAHHFQWVHTISRLKEAIILNEHCKNLKKMNVCIQVNISSSTQKSGVALHELNDLAIAVSKLSNLKLRGLMTLPDFTNDINIQKKNFAAINNAQKTLIEKGLKLDTLSMGMSQDFEAAIENGATIIRIGSAIFGPRKG